MISVHPLNLSKMFSWWAKCISWKRVTFKINKASFLSNVGWLGCWTDQFLFSCLPLLSAWARALTESKVWRGPSSHAALIDRSQAGDSKYPHLFSFTSPDLQRLSNGHNYSIIDMELIWLLLELCFSSVLLMKTSLMYQQLWYWEHTMFSILWWFDQLDLERKGTGFAKEVACTEKKNYITANDHVEMD